MSSVCDIIINKTPYRNNSFPAFSVLGGVLAQMLRSARSLGQSDAEKGWWGSYPLDFVKFQRAKPSKEACHMAGAVVFLLLNFLV